ncbi:hypothetical protein ABIA35_008283 [Catenulispora sp. MAP12-49]|uniref:hypothetical protein n=1 Tax=unclassified Catenulispora TaxID=414885 RepID=UPI0035157221
MPSATIVVYPSTDQGQRAGISLPKPNRDAAMADLRRQLVANGTAPQVRHRGPADGGNIPLHRLLRPLVPGGSLARGTIVAVPPRTGAIAAGAGGISYATLALIAGATAGGAWAGVIGFPNFGIAAASRIGADLSKMLMLDQPCERWPDAVPVLAGAVDLVLLHAPHRPNTTQLRHIANRIRPAERQRGCALVVTSNWEGAHLTLSAGAPRWEGLGGGSGNLTQRRVTISVTGRATHGRHREVDLWLPAADGTVREYLPQAQRRKDGRPLLQIA